MAKVMIKSDIFQFYLEEYGIKIDALAARSSISPENIQLWSREDSEISISNLRKIADVYKKHWGIFLLETRTQYFKIPKDYRARSKQKAFGLQANLAFEEASRLIELTSLNTSIDVDTKIKRIVSANLPPETIGKMVRAIMGIDMPLQLKWHGADKSYKFYIAAVEALGFIVSEQDLGDEDIDGFIVIKDQGVAIVINSKISSKYRKTFTLLHELGHYLQNVSATCLTKQVIHNVTDEQFANTLASQILLPDSVFELDPTIISLKANKDDLIGAISALSYKYSISMSSVTVRLNLSGILTSTEADRLLVKAAKIYQEKVAEEKRKQKEKEGFDPNNHERRAIKKIGRPLAEILISRYHNNEMSLRDVAGFMNVKVKLVGRIESMIQNG